MKKLIFLAFLCISAIVNATEPTLVLKMKDGTTHSFALASEPKITMSGYQLHFDGKDISASFNTYEVSEYSFELSTDISSVNANSYKLIGNDLHIYGNIKTPVLVYDVSGKAVKCSVTGDSAHKTVFLSSLPTGMYIVKTNSITIKVRRK